MASGLDVAVIGIADNNVFTEQAMNLHQSE